MAGSLYCFSCDTWNGSGPIVPKTICGCFDNETDALDWYHANLATNGGKCYNVELGSPWVTPGAEWGDDPGAFCGDAIWCWKIVCTGGSEFPFMGTINEALAFAASLGIENGCIAQVPDDGLLYCAPSGSAGASPGGSAWLCLGKLQVIGGKAVICSMLPADPCAGICIGDAGPGEWVVTISDDMVAFDSLTDPLTGCDLTEFPILDGSFGLIPYLDDLDGGFTRQCTWIYNDDVPLPGCSGVHVARNMYLRLTDGPPASTFAGVPIVWLRILYFIQDVVGLIHVIEIDIYTSALDAGLPCDCGKLNAGTGDWSLLSFSSDVSSHYNSPTVLTAIAIR